MKVAIIGVTGAVGQEMLQVLEKRNFPIHELRLFASPKSEGLKQSFRGNTFFVQGLHSAAQLEGCDIALVSAGGDTSRKFARDIAKLGCVVIDNSSAFRMEKDVPLIIPEINSTEAIRHNGIIANPNCSTIIALMALSPLHEAFGLISFVSSTYQAVSGTGAKAIHELEEQVRVLSTGGIITPKVYQHPIAYNVIPQVDVPLPDGYTKEERKMLYESRKILSHNSLKVSATCVRVPVKRAHSISVDASFKEPISPETARAVLSKASGITVIDDLSQGVYPMPIHQSGNDDCAVGRIRQNDVFENGLSFWVVGDQILKGAALNAVQIAELLY